MSSELVHVDLRDPTTAALVAAEALEGAELPYALYGGLLLAAYGEPRETRDVDVAVVDATAREACDAFGRAGQEATVAFEDTKFGGLLVARLTLLGGEADLGLNTVDLVRPRSARYREAAMARAVPAPLRNRTIRVLTPEDFVLFKLLSTRDLDIQDAASVLRRSGEAMDADLVAREVDRLAREIPDFDVRARHRVLLS
jgi:hypothetical protein